MSTDNKTVPKWTAQQYSEVRALRDAIYGPCSDRNWQACRDNWMSPASVRLLKDWIARDAAKPK